MQVLHDFPLRYPAIHSKFVPSCIGDQRPDRKSYNVAKPSDAQGIEHPTSTIKENPNPIEKSGSIVAVMFTLCKY